MSKQFLGSEKKRIVPLKSSPQLFTSKASPKGEYKGKKYDFCLPLNCAHENLFEGIRIQALGLFLLNGIHWHDGKDGFPSTHLCDSQTSCVNFLLPFSNNPDALKSLLNPFYPDIHTMLTVEHGLFVSFEWIGHKNYLSEKMKKGSERTRGANFTSADAIVRYKDERGKIHVILIEWKYTESYSTTDIRISKNGTDRSKIYKPLFDSADCPINKKILPHYYDLFYEPFYQFMRQQYLANEMEKAKELDADVVSVLHISPKNNTDFKSVTSPNLVSLGASATHVWKNLLVNQDRFDSVYSEDLFGKYDAKHYPELTEWNLYIDKRYSWINV